MHERIFGSHFLGVGGLLFDGEGELALRREGEQVAAEVRLEYFFPSLSLPFLLFLPSPSLSLSLPKSHDRLDTIFGLRGNHEPPVPGIRGMIDIKFIHGACTRIIFHRVPAPNFFAKMLDEAHGVVLEILSLDLGYFDLHHGDLVGLVTGDARRG
jgi:hypothetical protein